MTLDRLLFWRGSGSERPPQPDPETETESYTVRHHTYKIEFQNGTTETVQCHRMEYEGGEYTFKRGATVRPTHTQDDVQLEFIDSRTVPAAVLGEEPHQVDTELQRHKWRVGYEYQWRIDIFSNNTSRRADKEWLKTCVDISKTDGPDMTATDTDKEDYQ